LPSLELTIFYGKGTGERYMARGSTLGFKIRKLPQRYERGYRFRGKRLTIGEGQSQNKLFAILSAAINEMKQ